MEKEFFGSDLVDGYVEKLSSTVENASPSNINDGVAWYGNAYKLSEEIGTTHNIPGIVIRRVLSKISPRNHWERSLIDVENLILHGENAKIQTMNTFKRAAIAMLNDWNLHLFDAKKTIKTYNFFQNMNEPDKNTGLTIDRHAVKALGLPFQPNGKGINSRLPLSQYNYISNIYEQTSQNFPYLMHDLQAIIWLEQRAA